MMECWNSVITPWLNLSSLGRRTRPCPKKLVPMPRRRSKKAFAAGVMLQIYVYSFLKDCMYSRIFRVCLCPCSLVVLLLACRSGIRQSGSWPVYGGSAANVHYSALTQIDTANVGQLQKAWEYHTGD